MSDEADGRRRRKRKGPAPPRPLDAAKLQALALYYAARYATTAAKLRSYLTRKLRERPWVGDAAPDLDALVGRLVALGYVNDAAWATMKRREMGARGLGPRRVAQALMAAGVVGEGEAEENAESPVQAAVRFARRKRLGPFAREGAADDPELKRRAVAAMLRAGHAFDVARRVLAAADADAAEALTDD